MPIWAVSSVEELVAGGLSFAAFAACLAGWVWFIRGMRRGIDPLANSPSFPICSPTPAGWLLLIAFVMQIFSEVVALRVAAPEEIFRDWIANVGLPDLTRIMAAKVVASLAVVLAAGIVIAWLMRRGNSAEKLTADSLLSRPQLNDLKLGAICCGLFAPLLLALNGLLSLLPVFQNQAHPFIETLQRVYKTSGDTSEFIGLFGLIAFSVIVIAPLFEELLFRGLFQGWLRRLLPTTNSTGAIAGSALIFALTHLGHGPAPIPLFLFGLGLGYLYERTGRLWPCIFAHALFNATTTVLLWWQLHSPAPG